MSTKSREEGSNGLNSARRVVTRIRVPGDAASIRARLARGMASQSRLFFRSSSGVLVCIALLSNLTAYVASTSLPASIVELDQMVQPGSILSLVRTEGILMFASVIFFMLAPRGF